MTIILEQSTHTRTEDDITASTVQTQGQVPLTANNSIITTVANENDVVTLKQGEAGVLQRVVNAGANILQIFPALGQDLGNGVNNSITLAPNDHLEFLALYFEVGMLMFVCFFYLVGNHVHHQNYHYQLQ